MCFNSTLKVAERLHSTQGGDIDQVPVDESSSTKHTQPHRHNRISHVLSAYICTQFSAVRYLI